MPGAALAEVASDAREKLASAIGRLAEALGEKQDAR
jgi:hypothetical protein